MMPSSNFDNQYTFRKQSGLSGSMPPPPYRKKGGLFESQKSSVDYQHTDFSHLKMQSSQNGINNVQNSSAYKFLQNEYKVLG